MPEKKNQPKQFHNLPLYLGIGAAAILLTTLPTLAVVRTQQMLSYQVTNKPTKNVNVSNVNVNSAGQVVRDEIQTETFAQRQQAMLDFIAKSQESLIKAETALTTNKTLSSATTKEVQELIDNTQKELDTLTEQVQNATTVDQLIAARQDAMQLLYDNKDTIKQTGVDVYVDTMQTVLTADKATLLSAQTTLVVYQKYNENADNKLKPYEPIDITAFEQSVNVAASSISLADVSIKNADTESTRESFYTATVDLVVATQDVIEMTALQQELPAIQQ